MLIVVVPSSIHIDATDLASKMGNQQQLLLLACFIFFFLVPVIASDPTCSFPQFSYNDKLTEEWIAKRSQSPRQTMPINWSRFGKPRPSSNYSDAHISLAIEEFLKWLPDTQVENGAFERKFAMLHEGITNGVGNGLSPTLKSIALSDLKAGDMLLQLPLAACLSDSLDSEDPITLKHGPWELRLATKLLRERSKGLASVWAPYIKLMPESIPLPMFFNQLELNNIQDEFAKDEVQSMRKFAVSAFQSLEKNETAGAKFSRFVWALSIVFSSTCRFDWNDGTSTSQKHVLVPFFGMSRGTRMEVVLDVPNASLRLFVESEVGKGTNIFVNPRGSTESDTFLFQASTFANQTSDRARLFRNTQDLANWYFSSYGGVNNNRHLTLQIASDAVSTIAARMDSESSQDMGDFSIGTNGYVDPCMICILATLSYARKLMILYNNNTSNQITPLDFVSKDGTMWESILKSIGEQSLSINLLLLKGHLDFSQAFDFASSVIQARIFFLLKSYSTDLKEDLLLLKAADWEGFSSDDGSQLCPTCRWQNEVQSYNDNLAVQYRASRKALMHAVSAQLSNRRGESGNSTGMGVVDTETESGVEAIREFVNWGKNNGLDISNKLEIANFVVDEDHDHDVSHGNGSLVRGVLVIEDIEEGEILCTLSMHAGLFDKNEASNNIADSWDMAAARLLQERALGNLSRWASYIKVLPRDVPTPISMDVEELEEVQWWPVIRETIQARKAIKESFIMFERANLAWAEIQEYQWAAVIVHSRAFTLPVFGDDKYSHYVLMPYMDMINHHYIYQADWISRPIIDGKLEIVAKKDLRKGEQLFATFGPRSNDNLFVYYGFILKDNPFDQARLFRSFEDSLIWFGKLWNTKCKMCSQQPVAFEVCNRQFLGSISSKAQVVLEGDGIEQSKEWWDLVNKWADYGYQYLPYTPGPNLYSFGVMDPTLVSAYAAASSVIDFELGNLTQNASCPRGLCSEKSGHLKKFFICMEDLRNLVGRPLSSEHPCWPHMISALMLEDKASSNQFIARISIGLRCLEIISTFPTSIYQDKILLGNKAEMANKHVLLARKYRLMKKMFLRTPVEQLINSNR